MGDLAVSKAEFAKRRGVTAPMVSKWARAGLLVYHADGRVDPVASDAAIEAARHPSRGGKAGGLVGHKDASANAAAGVPSPSAGPTFTQVRTAREAYAVKAAELAYRKKVGELVEWAAVEKALSDAFGPIVTSIRSLSSRLATRVAAESDVRACTKLIDGDVDTVCQAAADAVRRLLETRGQP